MADDTMTDTSYNGISPGSGSKGYNCVLRKTGQGQIYLDDGTTATALAAFTSAAIADGTDVTLKLDVSPAGITFSRLNTDGSVMATCTTADTTYRGRYFQIGHYNLFCRFNEVTAS